MSDRPNNTSCPSCHAPPGTLSITIESILHAKPRATWSLAGVQMKTVASERDRPVLRCSRCSLRHLGDFDGRHAVFPPLPTQETTS